ncbi:hypothetical protein CJF35_19925 [Pseudomonas lundensis]|nr:hypothetical protein CJF35_19925 [Pseudomonas lundensis]
MRRRIVCRRCGASIGRGVKAAGCKSDSAIAESVNPRQSASPPLDGLCCLTVIWGAVQPESVPTLD